VARELITSPANARLKLVRKLASRKQREELGLFVCEGEDLVAAGLDAGLVPVEALIDAERPALEDRLPGADLVAPGLLAGIAALAHPPRVVAIFRRADLPVLDPARPPALGLALWQVGDPGNLGTILRSADAFGPAFVAVSKRSADATGTKALRASAGAVFRVPMVAFEQSPGRRIALVSHGGRPLVDIELDTPTTWVLGAEREGLPAEVVAECDEAATIEIEPSAESLNVAVAAAIALYESHRRAR
jgi:TrmH family RNA methyltransferase